MRKKKTKKMLICPIEGCKAQMMFQEHIEAKCIRHGYNLVYKEVEI